ncbi:MAG: Phosphoglycolate phosphatase [uncultured Sphingosinicella sp.]|uniref:Phosphoglycolate phosphatase n=1 Tax=uncultured Sphingosinicella sp. TaxID=478748 RepID=A0A6J4U9J5_9SPHN|nr:phosphoglycolate phosphatase [uncultured Sphingosinicella sp.]CAA9543332.1 MAG: Phosphoglycolate phosphatase [uncultured Sphingosinicella sp.]
MPAIRFDSVAFDLDGTLADTAPDIAHALNHALGTIGRLAIASQVVRTMIGDGARNLIRRALTATGGNDEALIDQLYPVYVDFYADHPCGGTKPFAGVEAAMDALAANGVRLAICTNKPERVSRALLEALGWTERFSAIVCGDTLSVRKPDPAPLFAAIREARSAAFVGDSLIDAETARAAAVPFVAVSFGYSSVPADRFGADAVIDSFDALIPALDGLSAAP